MSESTVSKIEGDLNVAGEIGAAVGGPIGAAVEAGLQGAEAVANTVIAEAPHQTALTDVANAVAAATPVVAAATASLPVATQAKVTASLGLLATILADLKAWL